MSLDVYLYLEGRCPDTGEPTGATAEVYESNITHNLNQMAECAGLYLPLWRPEEMEAKVGADLIAPLAEGLSRLEKDPDYYKQYEPENGWGSYDGLVRFTERYLAACQRFPNAIVRVSR